MAEHRRFADLDHGHPGHLTYLPADKPEDGPGLLHTARWLAAPGSALHFTFIGSSAELYPPSKTAIPSLPSQLWRERRLQRRWLLNAHPEAFMGNPSFSEYLKDDMERFQRAEETTDRRPLLVVGQMADLTDVTDVKGMPLLAAATGESGEQLRLARIDQSHWQWGDNKDVTLQLAVIDSAHEEDEVIWMEGPLPILQIKAVTYFSQYNSVRLLLVQKSTSTTILQPEYRPNPNPDSGATGKSAHQRPSSINPNPLLTLHSDQTGGNAHSDVSFNPAVLGRPPQLAVLDECGYWSVWNILGTWQVPKKTLRLSQYKCGHIIDGFLNAIPPSPDYGAERHGMLRVGKSEAAESYRDFAHRAGSLETITSPSQYMLLWNSERFELLDLGSDTLFARPRILVPSRTRPDRILDVQRSPLNEDHVFVLTTQQVIWVDLFCRAKLSGTSCKPAILLTCSHVGIGHEDINMSVARSSGDDADSTLVFTHESKTGQLCVYWFNLSPASQLPQWHRYITQLPSGGEASSRTEVQLIQVQPAQLEQSPTCPATGPGSSYLQSGVQFYQVSILEKDLGVRYALCTISSHSSLDVALPTTRLGWSKSEQRRRWKRKRKHFLRHIGDTFVIPDGMSDADLDLLFTRTELDEEDTARNAPEDRPSFLPRPIIFNVSRVAQAIREQLDLAASRGELGLPAQLMEAVHRALQDGLATGSLSLTTWAEIADELGHPVACLPPDDSVEEEVARLFDMSDDKMIVAQLQRHAMQDLPASLLDLPLLKLQFSRLWLDSTADKFPAEIQQIRRAWVAEVARDVFLSSYGVMVQDVPLLGPGSSDSGQPNDGDELATMASQSHYRGPRIGTSALAPSASTSSSRSAPADAALQRLKLLVTSLQPGKLGTMKPLRLLSYWPRERGVGTQDYVSSVTVAEDERFREARQRLQKIEAKRKAQAERYKRPPFMRQGFPTGDGRSPGEGSLPIRPPPLQAMSSQLAGPDSSQTQGPWVTMSQPVAGAFGDRKKVKKEKRKSGFR